MLLTHPKNAVFSSSDIDGLISILQYLPIESSGKEIDSIMRMQKATQKSIELGLQLGIIEHEDNQYKLNPSFNDFLSSETYQIRRHIITELYKLDNSFLSEIHLCTPRRITLGSKRVAQILTNAKLTIPLEPCGERWWLEFRWYLRSLKSQDDQKLGDIGDKGERLSMDYEISRLGTSDGIERISVIDGDKPGYDILSFTDELFLERKRIEVKASTQKLEHAEIYLTWNEYKKSKIFGTHEFHLWPDINEPNPEPIVVTSEKLHSFIPEIDDDIRWDKYIIPMRLLAH